MIIKKFEAATETEAIVLAKNELGKDAIVMNVKTIAPRGIYKLFRKTVVEVTAALDENKQNDGQDNTSEFNKKVALAKGEGQETGVSSLSTKYDFNQGFFSNNQPAYQELGGMQSQESGIEARLNNLQKLIEKQIKEKEEVEKKQKEEIVVQEDETTNQNLEYLRLIYNQLIDNEVDEKFANELVNEFDLKSKKVTALDHMLGAVYQKLVLKLGQVKTIQLEEGKTKFVFFIGPTGVGKTTTIAKIASDFLLHKKAKVGLLTADTYRVAAVEQLRTYANILGIPIQVIYSLDEMQQAKEQFNDFDLVLVDTAGRSHKNEQQKDDINHLIETIPEEDREVYLVLSATTKYRDLVRITEVYHEFTDYGLIFTKLDETMTLGNIYNVKMKTDAFLSYATIGQNVPDDILQLNPQEIAKQLLGGEN